MILIHIKLLKELFPTVNVFKTTVLQKLNTRRWNGSEQFYVPIIYNFSVMQYKIVKYLIS